MSAMQKDSEKLSVKEVEEEYSSLVSARSKSLSEKDIYKAITEEAELSLIKRAESSTESIGIVFDEKGDHYYLVIFDKATEEISMSVDGYTYYVQYEVGKIWLKDQDGLEIMIFEETDDPLAIPFSGEYVSAEEHIEPHGGWSNGMGPFHKTNQLTLTVFSIINTAIGSCLSSTIIGTVFAVLGIGITVGQSIMKTMHIKYYQYISLDNPTYVKEVRYYYWAYSQNSGAFYEEVLDDNYNQIVSTVYFYTSQPYSAEEDE